MKWRCGLTDQILSPHFHHTRPAQAPQYLRVTRPAARMQGFYPAPAPPRKSALRVARPTPRAAGSAGWGGAERAAQTSVNWALVNIGEDEDVESILYLCSIWFIECPNAFPSVTKWNRIWLQVCANIYLLYDWCSFIKSDAITFWVLTWIINNLILLTSAEKRPSLLFDWQAQCHLGRAALLLPGHPPPLVVW